MERIPECVSVEVDDPAQIATEAEEMVTRIQQRLLESDEGLAALSRRLALALDDCLANWPIRKACNFLAFQDLWRNVRFHLEDVSFDADPSVLFSPGEALRRSVLQHAYPFAADGTSSSNSAFVMRVDGALSSEHTMDALKNVTDQLFLEFFRQVEPRFDPANALPLVRVVPLIQHETNAACTTYMHCYTT